jgi:hypothetical protein
LRDLRSQNEELTAKLLKIENLQCSSAEHQNPCRVVVSEEKKEEEISLPIVYEDKNEKIIINTAKILLLGYFCEVF